MLKNLRDLFLSLTERMKSAIVTAADSMTYDDTCIGGEFRRFPTTRHSAIQELSSDDSSVRRLAADLIIRVYWKPVYKHIRIQWHKNNEDAKDLTQSFFTALLEKEYLKSFDASRGRFRTFLRTCLNRFMSNQAASAARIKRGGGIIEVSLDFAYAEEESLRSKELSPDHADDYFNREWVRGIIAVSLERFRRLLLSLIIQ